MTAPLARAKRLCVKVGSSLLVGADGLREDWLHSLVADLARRHGAGTGEPGTDVLVVSSGAIAMGRTVCDFGERPLALDEAQAAAAIGQIELARAWGDAFREHGLVAAQVLLTLSDTEGSGSRRSYLNARDTLAKLSSLRAVPVVNENDTVATSEIRYGDNDRLAARVATMAGADMLVLLSDIDGLRTAPPALNRHAALIERVDAITPEIEAMAGDAGSGLSRGGMKTKLDAARIATRAGCAMIIASGREDDPLGRLDRGAPHTLFTASDDPASARKRWIGGQLQTAGHVEVDEGAAMALHDGRSLLPAGVTHVEGDFRRGDTVEVRAGGRAVARGLVAYSASDARLIMGLRTDAVEERLGMHRRAALIHRDDLALLED